MQDGGADDDIPSTVPRERFLVGSSIGVVSLGSGREESVAATSTSAPRSSSNFSRMHSQFPKRKKRKVRKVSLYELYHRRDSDDDDGDIDDIDGSYLDEAATFGISEASSSAAASAAGTTYQVRPFEIGMDINILVNQVHQNVLRSICIDDYEGTALFLDADLVCLAAALRHNSSLLSLQLRYLPVTDVSLVPLCRALETHPSLRALDLSGTKGTRQTGEALRRLACTNTHILHIMVEDTMFQKRDVDLIEEAVQYNAMLCPDPRSNPFEVSLIAHISKLDRAQKLLEKQLNYNPWVDGPLPSSILVKSDPLAAAAASHNHKWFHEAAAEQAARQAAQQQQNSSSKGKRSVAFAAEPPTLLSQEVCADYVAGCCRYGSRCKHYHPPRTAALEQVAALQKYHEEEERRRQWKRIAASSDVASAVGGGSEASGGDRCSALRPWEEVSCSAFGSGGASTTASTQRSRRRAEQDFGGKQSAFTLDTRKVVRGDSDYEAEPKRAPAPAAHSLQATDGTNSTEVLPGGTINRMTPNGSTQEMAIVVAVCMVCCCAVVVAAVAGRRSR